MTCFHFKFIFYSAQGDVVYSAKYDFSRIYLHLPFVKLRNISKLSTDPTLIWHQKEKMKNEEKTCEYFFDFLKFHVTKPV